MALIVEDGTSKADANAYVSVADLKSYFEARNDTVMAETADEAVEGAILYATRDLDQSFSFHGSKTKLTQSRSWPRLGAYDKEGDSIDEEVVPEVVVEATCERAREHILTRALNEPVDPSGELKSLRVGPLSLDWNVEEMSPMPDNPFYTKLLRGLFVGGAVSREIVRA